MIWKLTLHICVILSVDVESVHRSIEETKQHNNVMFLLYCTEQQQRSIVLHTLKDSDWRQLCFCAWEELNYVVAITFFFSNEKKIIIMTDEREFVVVALAVSVPGFWRTHDTIKNGERWQYPTRLDNVYSRYTGRPGERKWVDSNRVLLFFFISLTFSFAFSSFPNNAKENRL